MIALLAALAQMASAPPPAEQVMTCYIQEDRTDLSDPLNPNQAHLVGPKYLIAWKFRPQTSFGTLKAPIEVHDPHGFLKGNAFGEQKSNAEGTAFFAGDPNTDLFMIAVMPERTAGGLHKAEFIHTSKKKLAGMAFGYCKVDEREAGEAFAFWKAQPETLP